ncbi:MAG: integrin alpha, partial [Synechococcaceae cyanobacterium ELA182]
MGTYTAPSIAYFNNTLYLCYVAAGSNELNVTYLKGGNTWATQYPIPGQRATAASMIAEGSNLAVYFTANDPSNRLLKSYSSQPSGTSWTNTSVLYGAGSIQTASGNLALTRYNNQTYLAYQGGTSATPSNTIYLTTASDTVANDGSHIWNLLDTPSGINPLLKTGVGLTSSSQGLVLTYTDNSQPQEVAVQFSPGGGQGWQPLDDGQALSSSLGYTPLITADASNPLLIAGMDSGTVIKAQLNALNFQVLSSGQTGSSLSALGDINGDGFDDLAISANNVAYAPSGNFNGSDAQLTTGVRVVLGAATDTALSSVNNANASVQAVQIANLYRQPSFIEPAPTITPVANLRGPAKLNLSGGQDGKLVQITSPATGSTLSDTSLSSSASNPSSLNKLFAGATSITTSSPTWSADQGSGSPSLYTQGGFGDLNADGYVDYLDEIPTTVYGPGGMSWSVWSIRAAGDANGNGVDDLLLSLAPQGPAYGQVTTGQPSALQSVLVDGSLFSVDKTTNTFRLDQLRNPLDGPRLQLNPYNRSQLFDVASTSSSDYLPSLQNWFEPILNFKPGSLTGASTANPFNPAGARSFLEPAVAISPEG